LIQIRDYRIPLQYADPVPGGRSLRHQARIAPDYAFFTGTQLFLLPEGHRSRPSVVRFDVPSGWRIASGLDDTAEPTVFTAPEYDTLVDQPTLMGQFDVTRFWPTASRTTSSPTPRACSRRRRPAR
jgi:predicted metalloprotease with PDZ domain